MSGERIMAAFGFKWINSDVMWLMFAFGLAGVQRVWRGYQERRAETWPISYGRIDRVTLDTEHKTVKFKCYYSYRVGEESFVGSFEKTFEDLEEEQAWQAALQKKQVAVRYDPGRPSCSQLRESDLEPIVRSAAPVLQVQGLAQGNGVKVFAAKLCSVVCAVGLAITIAVLVEEYIGKALVAPRIASIAGWAALPVFFVGLWIGGRDKLSARLPGWMKYLGYSLLYYAVLAALLAPGRYSRERTWADVRYQLFLYFSALECCYLRLLQKREMSPHEYGVLSGSSVK